MEEPEVIVSAHSQTFEENDITVEICIYRLGDGDWTLEIVSEDGCSTVWEDPFSSDEEALAIALLAIQEDGIESFTNEEISAPTIH